MANCSTFKVLFLDFDGVIVIGSDVQTANPSCIQRLNEITDATGAHIVVSSTWRHFDDYVEILKSWGVTGEIVGRTPECLEEQLYPGGRIRVSKPRNEEIMAYLSAGDLIEKFCILDDDPFMGVLLPQLVHTDHREGLTSVHVAKAIEMLNGRNS